MATSLQGLNLSDERIKELKDIADIWALSNGISMKASAKGEDSNKLVTAPYTLFPTVVPKTLLEQLKDTMVHFNTLMHRVALDHEFLENSLKNVIKSDDFMQKLWNIYTHVRNSGVKQPYMLGLSRNDFMLHIKDGRRDDDNLREDQMEFKQIEFNTIAASFAGLTQQIGHLHKLMLSLAGKSFTENQIPDNRPSTGFSKGLLKAWELYGNSKAVIMFLVSNDGETNTIDQRAIELGVYNLEPRVRIVFKTLLEVAKHGRLDENNKLIINGDEIALIYFRCGYSPNGYTSDKEWEARLTMEKSLAIKCPSVQYQLANAKKIQQELGRPGSVERFIQDPKVVKIIRETFAGQYSLDLGPEGDETMEMALANPEKFVLKPQREGGGNNLFNEEITKFLEENHNSEERNKWIVMERIFPKEQKNYLVKRNQPFELTKVISEVGVYGVFIGSTDLTELVNMENGHMMRTKPLETDEGGICAGFAVLDTPFLV